VEVRSVVKTRLKFDGERLAGLWNRTTEHKGKPEKSGKSTKQAMALQPAV